MKIKVFSNTYRSIVIRLKAVSITVGLIFTTLSISLDVKSSSDVIESTLRDVELVSEEIKPASFESVYSATGLFGNHCSGTYISNDGHILTALHCLPLFFKTLNIPEINAKIKLSPKKLSQEKMRFYMGSKGKLDMLGAAGKLVLLGKGFNIRMNPYEARTQNLDVYISTMKEGYGPLEDFAIIKLDRENTSCVKMSDSQVSPGEKVWSISYPKRSSFVKGRPLWKKSKGTYTSGLITNGIEDNETLQSIIKDLSKEDQSYWLDFFKPIGWEDGLTTSLDVLSGSSGASIIGSSSGEIIGLSNATLAIGGVSPEEHYYYGVGRGVSAKNIIDRAREALSSDEFAKVFDCKN